VKDKILDSRHYDIGRGSVDICCTNLGAIVRRLFVLLGILVLLAAGCGSDDNDTSTTSGSTAVDATTPNDPEPVVVPDEPSDVTLTLVTNDAFSGVAYLLDAFTAETGIGLDLVAGGDAGALVNQAILTKGNPLGDVLYGFDNTFLSRVLDAEITIPYESSAAAVIPAEMQLDPTYNVTAVDFGDVCINYDKAWFADNGVAVPEELSDLTSPEYSGLLTVENPATSSPGLAFMMATIAEFGEDGWLDFWAGLADNDVDVVSGWDEAYYASFTQYGGPRPLVVSYASSPPAEVIFAETPIDVAPTGVMESSCFRQIEYIAILEGTEHEAEAQQLIDWWLSDSMQAELPLNYFVFPVNPATALPQEFIDHTIIPESPHTLDPAAIAANREEWLDEWTSTVLR
jgi:thiamine transport system substrate-binding protein